MIFPRNTCHKLTNDLPMKHLPEAFDFNGAEPRYFPYILLRCRTKVIKRAEMVYECVRICPIEDRSQNIHFPVDDPLQLALLLECKRSLFVIRGVFEPSFPHSLDEMKLGDFLLEV